MLEYIIKSSACLAVFLLIYKLLLEKENMHVFKRFYLLASLLVSFGIPFITFTQYIEVPLNINNSVISNTSLAPSNPLEVSVNYVPYILWSIYFLGVFIFSLKFIINLSSILLKIKQNPKLKTQKSTNVLLKELIVPHTFLSYIFLNKTRYETQLIPKEVLIHEEVHAVQKHSLDILFIELFQIILWFNPLIYMLKKTVRLNHEFLADQEVIKQGVTLSKYQQILLAFSSNAIEPQLATAINYSFIKKRFTVMKTQTSKTRIWLKSLVLLPLLALLIFSFSERKVVEKKANPLQTNGVELLIPQEVKPVLKVEHNPLSLTLNGKITSMQNLETDFINLTNNQKSSVILESREPITKQFIDQLLISFGKNIISINTAVGKTKVIDENYSSNQDYATNEEVAEYNKLAKYYNSQPENMRLVKYQDLVRMEYIFKKMSEEQKVNSEPFPKIPPPPPNAPEMKMAHDLPPPPPIPADATPEEKAKYQKTIDKYYETHSSMVKKGEESNIPPPPPPPPKSPIEHIKDMEKKGAIFYFENEKITAKKAVELLKNNDKLNILTRGSKTEKPIVKLKIEPITIDD